MSGGGSRWVHELVAAGFIVAVAGCSGADPSTSEAGDQGATGGASGGSGATGGSAATGGTGATSGTNATGGTGATEPDCVQMEPPAGGGGAPGCAPYPAPMAGDVLYGDLTIANAANAEAARAYTEIQGDLVVTTSYCGVLELPNLVTVGGSVNASGSSGSTEVDWPRLRALRLPNLKSIGGEIMVYLTNALVETDFRSLESVGYRVYYERNIVLRRFGLDSLAQTGSLVFSACFEAARCELEAICSQVAPTTCAISTGLTTCACETSCGRLAPVCPTM